VEIGQEGVTEALICTEEDHPLLARIKKGMRPSRKNTALVDSFDILINVPGCP
jgi:hypothetical protein